MLKNEGVTGFKVEHRFFPDRKWRFDFAWIKHRVAVEIEGGVWNRGRHVRPQGFEHDTEKYNTATMLGWRVLRFTGEMVGKDPNGCLQQIKALLS